MEKSSLCRNMKQQSMTSESDNSRSLMKDLYCYKFKSSSAWHFGNNGGEGGDLAFSWPPRSYTCSFCKREFRSAQALGGHMNVHRRDRARLNQLSPVRDGNNNNYTNHGQFDLLNLSLDLNPSSSCHYPKCSCLPPLFTPDDEMKNIVRPSSLDLVKMKSGKALLEKLDEKAEFVRLDLEIGLINQSYEDELDLELRLGYC